MDFIFPYLEKIKKEKCIPKEQYSLVIMGTFKGQNNDILKKLCDECFCEVVIVLQIKISDKEIPAFIYIR